MAVATLEVRMGLDVFHVLFENETRRITEIRALQGEERERRPTEVRLWMKGDANRLTFIVGESLPDGLIHES